MALILDPTRRDAPAVGAFILGAAVVALLAAAGISGNARATDNKVQDVHQVTEIGVAQCFVYIDPETGEFIEGPSEEPPPGGTGASLPPLVAVPSSVPGGGFIVEIPEQ
jgi:hypothetical protein